MRTLQFMCPLAAESDSAAVVLGLMSAMQDDVPRDVTPSSVMVDQDMSMVIYDISTRDLSFQAPEVILQAPEASSGGGLPQKLYTLGALIYYAFTGMAPCHSSDSGLFGQPDASLLPETFREGVMALLCTAPEGRSIDRLLETMRRNLGIPLTLHLLLENGKEAFLLDLAPGNNASFNLDISPDPMLYTFVVKMRNVEYNRFSMQTMAGGTPDSFLDLSVDDHGTLYCGMASADGRPLAETEITL